MSTERTIYDDLRIRAGELVQSAQRLAHLIPEANKPAAKSIAAGLNDIIALINEAERRATLAARPKPSREQLRADLAKAEALHPEMSNRELGKLIGASKDYVGRNRATAGKTA